MSIVEKRLSLHKQASQPTAEVLSIEKEKTIAVSNADYQDRSNWAPVLIVSHFLLLLVVSELFSQLALAVAVKLHLWKHWLKKTLLI